MSQSKLPIFYIEVALSIKSAGASSVKNTWCITTVKPTLLPNVIPQNTELTNKILKNAYGKKVDSIMARKKLLISVKVLRVVELGETNRINRSN